MSDTQKQQTDPAGHPLLMFKFCPRCGEKALVVNNEKSKRCTLCGFVWYSNPVSAVACFINDGNGGILVATRGVEPAMGTLDLPGGFVDHGETAEEAVYREIAEETGLTVNHTRYLFSVPNIYPYSGFLTHTLDMFFEVQVRDITGFRAADDVSALTLIPVGELEPSAFGLESIRRAVELYKGREVADR